MISVVNNEAGRVVKLFLFQRISKTVCAIIAMRFERSGVVGICLSVWENGNRQGSEFCAEDTDGIFSI